MLMLLFHATLMLRDFFFVDCCSQEIAFPLSPADGLGAEDGADGLVKHLEQ